jgi:hypothetical protein
MLPPSIAGPFLTLIALAHDVVHLTTIQFIFLLSDIAVYRLDAPRPVAGSTISSSYFPFLPSAHPSVRRILVSYRLNIAYK